MEQKREIVREFIHYSNHHNDGLYGRGSDVSYEKQLGLCSNEQCFKIVLKDETRLRDSNGNFNRQFYQRCCDCGNIVCEEHQSMMILCDKCHDTHCNLHNHNC